MGYKTVNGKLVKTGKANIRKGNGFKLTTTDFGGFKGFMFDYMTEFQKAANMVLADPPTYDVKSTRADYQAMGFGNAGFLLALVPTKKFGAGGYAYMAKNKDAETVKSVVQQFSVEQITDDWAIFKTYITRDIAFQKFELLHGVLHTAFIAYSTPENISTLSEDKDFIRAYAGKTDPFKAIEVKA